MGCCVLNIRLRVRGRKDRLESHGLVPAKGLNGGGGFEGEGSRGAQCIVWRENKQSLVMDWMWGMNEKEVPKLTPRFLS